MIGQLGGTLVLGELTLPHRERCQYVSGYQQIPADCTAILEIRLELLIPALVPVPVFRGVAFVIALTLILPGQ